MKTIELNISKTEYLSCHQCPDCVFVSAETCFPAFTAANKRWLDSLAKVALKQNISMVAACKREHQPRQCSFCAGTGKINMHVPVPFSEGELYEDYQEQCPLCGGT